MKSDCKPFPGALVISLDFELHWGLINAFPLEAIRERLLGTRKAIPLILKLFEDFEIHATWASVGFLFHRTRNDLVSAIPDCRPSAENGTLTPYDFLADIGLDELSDPHHYASSIVDQIRETPNQEVATHTFAHCIWDHVPADTDAFRADLRAVFDTARTKGVVISSIVFPQNKYSPDLLRVLKQEGIIAFRGGGQYWYSFLETKDKASYLLFRCLRMVDRHISLSGSNVYTLESIGDGPPYNVPGSMGLEYFSHAPWLSVLEPLRLRRLASSMRMAAEQRKIFHLWWHPHQFGEDSERKLDFLKRFLSHFADLREKHGIESLTMKEVVERLQLNGISTE